MSYPHVLVVEDDVNASDILAFHLRSIMLEPITANTGRLALQLWWEWRPALLIIDIRLPDIDGLEICQHIRDVDPYVPIIVLTALDDNKWKIASYRININTYITKPVDYLVLREIILAQMRYAQRHATMHTKNHFVMNIHPHAHIIPHLTKRELDVLQWCGTGKSTHEIAQMLGISSKTVEKHLGNLYRKLKVHSRAEVVYWATCRRII